MRMRLFAAVCCGMVWRTANAENMKIESLLSARLFLTPQLVDGRLYFVSNQSGRLSLYAMDTKSGGTVPAQLLPPRVRIRPSRRFTPFIRKKGRSVFS